MIVIQFTNRCLIDNSYTVDNSYILMNRCTIDNSYTMDNRYTIV